MTNQDYKEISPELLALACGNTWSMENMAEHGADGRTVEYVGSITKGNIVRDYYRDNSGAWWYKNRAIVNGCIVSMEAYIFGKEITKARYRKWNS